MKKKSILIWLIAAAVAIIAAAVTLIIVFKDSIFSVPPEAQYTFINPDPANAETDAGMKIDGVFDETVYEENTWFYLHNANGGNTVDVAITSYFGEKGIYFAYEVRENTPIYVNLTRPSWMNSCIEMYLVPSDVPGLPTENMFEIDLLPTGHLLFKRPNAAGGWSDVSTTNDKMAYLGAKPFGGEVNTDECTGYDLELFIPYDYLEYLGVDSQLVKNGYVNVNPSHITSYNQTGLDGTVDRFWYSFSRQLGGDGWENINRYFKFNKNGAMGTVANTFESGENCTLSGKPSAIPGLNTTITVTPDEGYTLTSILCNGKELIQYVNYNQDGSVTLTLPATNEGMTFSAKAEAVTAGNKNLTGKVVLKNIFGDTLEGVSASYEDASGQHKLELNADGSFLLEDIPQGFYTIYVKKDGYQKIERTLYVDRDLDVVVDLPYALFEVMSGNCWNTSCANDGVLTKINGTGTLLTKDFFEDFYTEVSLFYSDELSQEFVGDEYQQQRMGAWVKFDNEKTWHIDLVRHDDGNYYLQYGKIFGDQSLFNWDVVHSLTPAQIERYKSEQGIKLGVLRTGRTAYIYLDNALVARTDLGVEQASCKAQIGVESFVANAGVMTVPFHMDVKTPDRILLEDAGSTGATVSLNGQYVLGDDVTLFIRKETTNSNAKLLSVQVNGRELVQDVVSAANGYKLTIGGNQEKILSVQVIYSEPVLKTLELDLMDTDADGISVRLLQDGAVQATAVVQNGKAVFTEIYQGSYQVQARIYDIWTDLNVITVLEETKLSFDIKSLFENPEFTNYTGNVIFSGTSSKGYSIATEISGDAWFSMKLQLDKAKLDAVAANKGNVRLGYRMMFGGYRGNYEWENEYEITLRYTDEGKWVFEQMNTWQNYEIPENMVSALTSGGLYLVLHRDADTGVLTLLYGATEEELLSGEYACKWENEKHKQTIMRFGVIFWSEKGSNYQAKVTNLRYGNSLTQLWGIKETSLNLRVSGHKNNSYFALPQGTEVLVENAMNSYALTTDASGKIYTKILPGRYNVIVDGYIAAKLEIPQPGIEGELVLEYSLFYIPTGWDAEKHDFSKANDSTPMISTQGGTMNVLTNDSFGDVSASLWVKESNSVHSAHTQGIWIRFEDDKYMILYQEDAKLAYMQQLWHIETAMNTYISVSESLPSDVLNKWISDGYELQLIRKENRLYVFVDGSLYHAQTLPEAYADDQVQIGFFAFDSAETAVWNFKISTDLPTNGDARIVSNIPVENGTTIRLLQNSQIVAEGTFADNQLVLQNLSNGSYEAQIKIFDYWATINSIEIFGNSTVVANVGELFENAEFADFDGNLTFTGTSNKGYSISSEISGDAWFAMKLQLDKAQLDAVAANKGNIRLGYRMFFGGYQGNYEWENEYEITLRYTADGKWVFEQMNTWQSYEIPANMVSALTSDGLYFALHRDADTGVLTLYYGATEAELRYGAYACRWENEKHKQTIMRFGVSFWSENGSNYQATVTDLRYAPTQGKLFDIEETDLILQISEYRDGTNITLPEGTKVQVKNGMNSYQFFVDANGKITGKVMPGSYDMLVGKYTVKLEIPESGLEDELVLEYDMFYIPTGWDTEKHDLSKVNDANPSIAMSGGTMNVLTNDSFGDVSASLWVKESNSVHSAHTQGIWIRFEDGKYMILYQEDAKLAYMQKLWHIETVMNAYKPVSVPVPGDILSKWSSDGYELQLIRKDNHLYVFIEGNLYHAQTLPEAYADDQVQIGFFSFDSAATAVWNFKISTDIPTNGDAHLVSNVPVENGTAIRLLQNSQIIAEGAFTDNELVLQNLPNGSYDVQIKAFNYWTTVDPIEIFGNSKVTVNIGALFENANFTDFDGNMTFSGTSNKGYSVASEISGNAWFAMKLQIDKAKLNAVAANKGNVRLGYRMMFGGYRGNYEWENEYEITLRYTPEGKWVFEQMNTWQNYEIPADMVSALTSEGLYLVLHREADTGALTLYYGATEEDILSGKYSCKWENDKHNQAIMRFGAIFWSEKGSNYQATVTGLQYGETLEDALS